LTARTVAVWSDGHFEDNVTYALKDTPCGDVVGKTVCCFPASVCQLFPNDQVLQDLKAESYVGVTLWSHTHEPIGLIAVISRRPLADRQAVENIMNLVGICAAGEMERLDAAALLQKSEAKYRQLFHNQPTAYALHEIIVDAEGKPCDYRFLEINPAFEEYTGLKAADIIGKTQSEVIPNSESYWVETYGKVALTGEAINFENFSGELNKHYQVSAYSPEPGKFATAFVDISDRIIAVEEKQLLEQQLQHTQKLESLGVLSGGIAHDFNNILAIIVGYCSLTKMDYETAENNIAEIEKAAERAAALCRQMLAYAGKAQLSMSQINMRSLTDEMVTMLKATLPQNAEINPDLSTDVPSINGDSSQIRQIIMNLIINASEAIGKEHGEIRVSLATTDIKTGQSEQDYNGNTIPPGKYVYLEVTDNGCGMDEETKWRIFEPFYTTKFTGRGLGMSAVLGIIKSHGGALQLHSQLGQGTTFKVYLPVPLTDSAGNENTSASLSSAPWKGSGTILLVEDEDQVRLIAKALLKNIGFYVLEAVNGKEALELYQKNATDITLVMTDMGMPIMDGYELFSELKKLNPELPIIVSSGYGDAEVNSRIDIDNIAGLISKPYRSDQLREVLKRTLEGIK
ncbi:MAG: ATP-binding protein, partial [Deltaproteobacteria bacterium]